VLRPTPRPRLLAGPFGSFFLSCLVLFVPSVVLAFAVSMSRFDFATITDRLPLLGDVLLLFTLAAFAYGALFLFLSVLVPWPVYIGIALTIGYEAIWIRIAPGSMRLISYVHPLHVVGYQLTQESAFHTEEGDPTLWPSLRVLLIAPLCFLLLAWLRFRRKEYAFN